MRLLPRRSGHRRADRGRVIKLRHAEYWLPGPGRGGRILPSPYVPSLGTILCLYLWFETFLGWILTTLFVAGLTGLIRK
jgi:hypothetical protein